MILQMYFSRKVSGAWSESPTAPPLEKGGAVGGGRYCYWIINLEMISFMISVVPPPMERIRLSRKRRSTTWPRM